MDLDGMQSVIGQALADKVISTISEYGKLEASGQPQSLKDAARIRAIKALENIIAYLKGEYGVLLASDIRKAKELEEKEPQFIAVAEQNQGLVQELAAYKMRWSRLQDAGVVDENGNVVSKKTSPKKKSKPPKAKVAKKKPKKKAAPKAKKNQCPKCSRKFKSGAGLARHEKSCKG